MDNKEVIEQAEKILGRRLYCRVPFEQLQFFSDGRAYACCSALVDKYTIGNIFEQNFEEIWNGEKISKFRESILDGSFKFCKLSSCLSLQTLKEDPRFRYKDGDDVKKLKSPNMLHLNIDDSCNVKCIMCRDRNEYKAEIVKRYEEFFRKELDKILKNTEIVYLNGAGELFVSKICREITKRITSKYPHIKLDIITNGIYADRENFEELGIKRLNSIEVSMHAYSKEVYNKIVRNGNYEKVMNNLKFLSQMKREGKLECFWLNFVVSAYNYKEMIKFQEFAESIGAKTNFWEYRRWGHTNFDKYYEENAIFEPTHRDYKEFKEITSNPIFDSENCSINKVLRPEWQK